MIEHFSTLFALAAQYASEKQRAGDEATNEEFRAWLREVAFPELIKNSEMALSSVVSMKAHNTHQFETLLARLDDIEAAIRSGGPDAHKIWRSLTDEDRQLLSYLGSRCDTLVEVHVEWQEAREATGLDLETLERSARALSETGLAAFNEHSGGWLVGSTPTGHLVYAIVQDPEWVERASTALCQLLPNSSGTTTVAAIAEHSASCVGRVFALLSNYADQGLLQLQLVMPITHTRVSGLAESLRRKLS